MSNCRAARNHASRGPSPTRVAVTVDPSPAVDSADSVGNAAAEPAPIIPEALSPRFPTEPRAGASATPSLVRPTSPRAAGSSAAASLAPTTGAETPPAGGC